MKQNVLDLTAKLLATENINIFRKKVNESKFDIKTRTLVLPQWKGISKQAETALIGQEVGHALYTTSKLKTLVGNDKLLNQYSKVVDNIRVEKLVKRKYPGIAKDFSIGYSELSDKGIFGKKVSFSQLNLIDRINLYSKLGHNAGVSFTAEERDLYDAVEACVSEDDVNRIAREILEYSKKQQEPQSDDGEEGEDGDGKGKGESDKDSKGKSNGSQSGTPSSDNDTSDSDKSDQESDDEDDNDSESDSSDGDEDGEDDQDTEGQNNGSSKSGNKPYPLDESALESKTLNAIKDNVGVDNGIDYAYTKVDENVLLERVMGYQEILAKTKTVAESPRAFDKFYTSMNSAVSYLTKEFEMRKSATQYKRAQVSKSGALDTRKLYAYKLKEDLFKSITTLPNGKNHGMIFLLDWSGSMNEMLDDTMAQLIPLAYFCHKNQIKYKVLAFSDNTTTTSQIRDHRAAASTNIQRNDGTLTNECSEFRLLEFFSNEMSSSEFKTMAKRLFRTRPFRRIEGFDTGSTPLNNSLAYMTEYIDHFLASTKVEKFSFITLTDGESTSVYYNNGGYKREVILRDQKTKIEYPMGSSAVQTFSLIKMIKDRYKCPSIGFYIGGSLASKEFFESNVLTSNCGRGYNELKRYERTFTTYKEAVEQYAKNQYVSVSGSPHDEFFYIPSDALAKSNTSDSNIEVDTEASVEDVASAFTASMANKIKNKILLNRFVELIA